MESEHKEISRKGGMKTYKRHGRKFYVEIGKKGARAKLKKYGTEYFKNLSILGVAARKAKRDAQRPLINKIVDAIMPNPPPEKDST